MATATARRSHATPTKILLYLAGAALAVALVLAGAFALLGAAVRDSFDVRASYAHVRTLVVKTDNGAIKLTGAPAGEPVAVTAHVERGLDEPRRSAARGAGGTLTLTGDCQGIHVGPCEVGYEIAVPAGTRVVARSGAGPVQATSVEGDPEVRLSSGAGAVTVHGIRAKAVHLETAAGEIEATGVDAASVSATSAAGGVAVSTERAPTELQAHSDAGSVAIEVPDVPYALHTSAPAGKVIDEGLRQDTTSPRRLSATSDAGDVVVLSVR